MRRFVCLMLTTLIAITTMEGCTPMSTQPDLSYVKEGLVIPASYEEVDILGIDALLAEQKGLILDGTVTIDGVDECRADEYYLTLQAYYRKVYEYYLFITLRLDIYDKQIENSGLGFVPMPQEDQTSYEKVSNLSLKHLYVRNDIHIGYLTQEDADILKRLYAENGDTVTQEALDFVERTYPEVIMMLRPYQEGVYVLLTGAGLGCDPRSVLVVFTAPYLYDEFGNDLPGDIEQSKRREEYLLEHLPEIRKEMQSKLSVPITLMTTTLGEFYQYAFDDVIRYGPQLYTPTDK